MGVLTIEKNQRYAESNIAVIGITKEIYGRPQFFLVNSDGGENPKLKFPGSRFRAPISEKETLEDVAKNRFEEQTGLRIEKMLGLRAILSTRGRNDKQWGFRNIFLGVVKSPKRFQEPDGNRKTYVAEPGQGIERRKEKVSLFGDSRKKISLDWVSQDNRTIARITKQILNNFDWQNFSTNYYKKIPIVPVEPQVPTTYHFDHISPLSCGLAIAGMMVLYQPSSYSDQKIILVKRKVDKFPGFAGGKIETIDESSLNLDPISCCMKEGAEEFGFEITPRALICVATTPLYIPQGKKPSKYYNTLINYAFIAEPRNPLNTKKALETKKFLEEKMESYVVLSLDEFRDRVEANQLRMPDMHPIGRQFYKTPPSEKIPLTQIISSGVY